MCDAFLSSLKSQHVPSSPTEEGDSCWICLRGDTAARPLTAPCGCASMRCHTACLARWQLQKTGTSEEFFCRFCASELPNWREAHEALPRGRPIMTVCHNGVSHHVLVEPGPEGQQQFQATVRRIFGLEEDDAMQLTFGCKVPGSPGERRWTACCASPAGRAISRSYPPPSPPPASEVTLEGWDSYDAAVHCAAISAGQRVRQNAARLESQQERQQAEGPQAVVGNVIRRLFSRG
jgi:hypothetical protein